MTRDATTAFARTLVDEWVRHGVTDACLAPGSRSAPLALALAGDERIRLHVFLDERSAAFFAARAGARQRASRGRAVHVGDRGGQLPSRGARSAPRPGAADRVHRRPSARAARHRRRPDRRPGEALRRRGAVVPRGRTCPTTAPASVPTWRALASALGGRGARCRPPGPVHLNLPFREPLVPTGEELVDAPGRSDGRPWTAHAPGVRAPSVEMLDALAHLVADRPRGLVVAGWGAGVRPATVLALRRGRRLAGARRPAVEPARARHGRRPTTRCSAVAGVRRRRTGPTSCSASARRPRTRSRCSGSARRSTRCSSTPTTRGSTRSTRRAVGWSPTPSCCSVRSPTRST